MRRAFATLGARQNIFRTVGVPPAALKISLAPSQTAIARGGLVLAAEDKALDVSNGQIEGPAQLLLGLSGNPVVIAANKENWTLSDKYIVASTKSSDQTVVAAPGGVVRVDVPIGADFIGEKEKVVGYTGSPGLVVFRESRFDIAKAWLGWTSQRIGHFLVYAANGLRMTLTQVTRGFEWTIARFRSKSNVERNLSAELPATEPLAEPVSTPSTLVRIKAAWAQVVPYLSRSDQYVRDRLFAWTHPPKLRFVGPCSVLVKK